jgi:ribonuclease D
MNLITKTQDLRLFCEAVLKQQFVAVDTEFLRESTYWPKLCLIQAACDGAEAVIDPLAEGLDLAPFLEVLAAPHVLKVFHAARQDLEIFHRLMGALPAPLFDTQIGAMACGFGESIAYDALVQAMLRKRVDKSSRFTDWSRRPLSADQLAYALADVTHLRSLYPIMADDLATRGRADWVKDEHDALIDPANYDTTPANAWLRLKVRKHGADYLTALQVTAAWRETQAQARDTPRARVMKDEALFEVAEQRPRSTAAFDRLRIVPKGFGGSRAGIELARLLDEALSNPDRQTERPERREPSPQASGPTIELLRVLLRRQAELHGVAPRLIANAADLEAIAADDNAKVAALEGWRRDVFGAEALALKSGALGLRLKDGQVEVFKTDPDRTP